MVKTRLLPQTPAAEREDGEPGKGKLGSKDPAQAVSNDMKDWPGASALVF